MLGALLSGLWLTWRLAQKKMSDTNLLLALASWALPAGFLGARFFNVLENWEHYLTRPAEIVDPASGGLSLWGAIVGGGLATLLYCRLNRRGLGPVADAAAPGLALGEALGRLGLFLDGDGQGLPSDLFWATRYSSHDALSPDIGVPRHPAQVYQGLVDLLLVVMLWRLRSAELPAGALFWLWLGLYGLSRVLIGLVRLDPAFLFGLQLAQLVGLAAIALSAFVMIRTALRRRDVAPSTLR